ncbi:DUF86 domain-containing protein [Clostridium omnivorum]|nr:DUF86 domain-containing protein [Clostridium sp. E14]
MYFSNILVHDYIKLDRDVVCTVVINNLKNIEEFMKVVSEDVQGL